MSRGHPQFDIISMHIHLRDTLITSSHIFLNIYFKYAISFYYFPNCQIAAELTLQIFMSEAKCRNQTLNLSP